VHQNIHVALYGGKESLEPFIRCRVRKIASEDLHYYWKVSIFEEEDIEKGYRYFEWGSFFDVILLRSRRHAILCNLGGLGVGHF
jgi:hypothetical protein